MGQNDEPFVGCEVRVDDGADVGGIVELGGAGLAASTGEVDGFRGVAQGCEMGDLVGPAPGGMPGAVDEEDRWFGGGRHGGRRWRADGEEKKEEEEQERRGCFKDIAGQSYLLILLVKFIENNA